MTQLMFEEHTERRTAVDLVHEDPAEIVATRLRRSGYPFLWGLSCRFNQGILSISGTLPTYHLKQVAQELAMHTPGVTEVQNQVGVTRWCHPMA